MRAFERTPVVEIYQKAYHLYQLRILTIFILIPLYALTCLWGNLKISLLPLYIVIFVEVFINRPYKFLYQDSKTGFQALVASVFIDFLSETTALHLIGNVDVFIYSSCYFISIVYCALNLPAPLTFELATLASALYASLIVFGRIGIIPQTVSFGEDLDMTQEIAIIVRHVAFFYLIAIFIRLLAMALVKKEEKLEDLIWELKSTNEKMKHTYRLQTDYFAGMSHEIRSPLNSILGFSQLLIESNAEPLTVKQKDFLTRIENSGKHLRNLINDVLDISKIEAKKLRVSLQNVSLEKVLNTAFDMFSEEALQKRITLRFDEKPSRPLTIFCDELKIRQVLFNLLSNALKFTSAGGSVRMSLLRDGNGAKIIVEDSGPGIPAEHIESIFRPYEQAGRASERGIKGTGLGLSISKQFVEMHGGKIWVESQLGKGSKFFVQLPVQPPPPPPEEKPEPNL